jgi:hypothetical protein
MTPSTGLQDSFVMSIDSLANSREQKICFPDSSFEDLGLVQTYFDTLYYFSSLIDILEQSETAVGHPDRFF